MFSESNNNKHYAAGWIEVITGSMFSGKTEELIRRLNRARIARQEVAIFKPAFERRYARAKVVSHDQKEIPSTPVENAESIIEQSADVEVIGIDEAQFLNGQLSDVCNTLATSGKRVIVAGLDMDFRGKPFGSMPELMATAEFVTKVHAICIRCGNLANFSHRLTQSDDLVELGEKDKYEPLCRDCFSKLHQDQEKE